MALGRLQGCRAPPWPGRPALPPLISPTAEPATRPPRIDPGPTQQASLGVGQELLSVTLPGEHSGALPTIRVAVPHPVGQPAIADPPLNVAHRRHPASERGSTRPDAT